jgi:hypothetical protein
MVGRFFAEITRDRIRRGAFKSVAELKTAIMEFLEKHNADPQPFIWTKSAGRIGAGRHEVQDEIARVLGRRARSKRSRPPQQDDERTKPIPQPRRVRPLPVGRK